MRGRLIVALAFVATIVACEPPFDPLLPQQRRVLVHAILDPSTDTQRVMLEWTVPLSGAIPILGAAITVTAPDGRTAIATRRPNSTPNPDAPARYILLLSEGLQALQAGGTYRISIAIAGQPTITGTTTVPNALPTTTISTRTFPFVRERDTLRMTLPRVPGATGYQVLSTGRFAAQPNDPFPVVSVFSDTAVVLPGTLKTLEDEVDFFPSGMVVDVVALAVDDNYFTYFTTATDPFAGAPPSRLTGGAVGLFGSVVPLRRHRFPVQ